MAVDDRFYKRILTERAVGASETVAKGAVKTLLSKALALVVRRASTVTRALIRASAKGNARKQQGNKIAEHPYEEEEEEREKEKILVRRIGSRIGTYDDAK